MENSHTIFYAIGSILSTIAQLLVIIGCIIMVIKQKNGATILMLVGSLLSLLFAIGNFSGTFIASRYGPESILSWNKVAVILSPLPYILFGIGLLLLAVNHIEKRRT